MKKVSKSFFNLVKYTAALCLFVNTVHVYTLSHMQYASYPYKIHEHTKNQFEQLFLLLAQRKTGICTIL